jgi:hypothetical protein
MWGVTEMARKMSPSRWRRAGGALAVAAGAAGAASSILTVALAETICVACVGPDQQYRCEVQADGGGGALRAAPLACAARIAQDNGHSSCSVTPSTKNCDGIIKVYRPSDLTRNLDALAPAGASGGAPGDEADAGSDEPATFADMTRDTFRKSRENARKAGEAISGAGKAVGDAARRTLNCLKGGDC